MGYFSNGSEGAGYQDRWCSRCVHDRNQDCPVWLAHLLKNYTDCNDKGSVLHLLIPLKKDGIGNDQCRMFIEEPKP